MGKKKKKGAKPSQTQVAIKWSVRVFVVGILAMLVVFAYADFQTKSQAQQTLQAWLDRYDELADGRIMRENELDGLIVGNPTMHDGEVGVLERPKGSTSVKVYEWAGIFRTYSIKVGLLSNANDLFGGRMIETIEGPGGLATSE